MNEEWYRTLRRCFTGVCEYRFCRGDDIIGRATAHIVPAYPLMLQCNGLFLSCKRDPDMTLVPGMSLPITDADCGEEFGRVFWDGHGQHRLHTPYGHFRLEYREGIYLLSKDDAYVGGVTRVQKGSPAHIRWSSGHMAEQEDGWEFHLAMMTAERFPDELALLLQLFPLLAIGP